MFGVSRPLQLHLVQVYMHKPQFWHLLMQNLLSLTSDTTIISDQSLRSDHMLTESFLASVRGIRDEGGWVGES